MSKKKSIFSTEKEATVTVSIKVPASLRARADAINQQLDAIAPGKTFNVSMILSDAYKSAVETAEQELQTLIKNPGRKTAPEKTLAQPSQQAITHD